jgi:uncharacterized membrane protein YozB (DUF420 family)
VSNQLLATIDALFSVAAIVFMVRGVRAIRRGDVERHRRCMLTAFVASASFMVLFVVRFATFGFRPFVGHGLMRVAYSLVFFTHEPMAVVNIPLVLAALVLGLRRSDAAHREIVGMAYPIWLYAASTGVALYVLLYVVPSGSR